MIDDFSLSGARETFDPLSVVLFKALQVIAFLFFLTLIMLAAQDDKKGKVESKAEFLISMAWPDDHPDDFDIFVQDPLSNVVWYRRRDSGFMVLERDNRGQANDFVMIDGKKVRSATRQELVSVRGIVPGEYTVNVYHFVAQAGQPVPVQVTVEKLNPTVSIVSEKKLMMDGAGSEKTAMRFTLDGNGEVTKVSEDPRSILQTFFNASKDGGPL